MSLDQKWVIQIIYQLLSSSNIPFKLREDVKKCIDFEFCFASNTKKLINFNELKIYPKKGKIFWKIIFKTREPTRSLEELKEYNYNTYSIDWITDENNISVGGFRKCIYTGGIQVFAEEFLYNTFKEFKKIFESLN